MTNESATYTQVELGRHTWWVRPGTNDLGIIEQNYVNSTAHLPDDIFGWRVMDIGAHIGSFSVLAAERGATVDAFEPTFNNRELLRRNTAAFPGVTIYAVGVGRRGTQRMYLDRCNTGQNSVYQLEGHDPAIYEDVRFVSLETALQTLTYDFVKLDVEGGEYNILEEMLYKGLHNQVLRLLVSFHDIGNPLARPSACDSLEKMYKCEPVDADMLFTRRSL